MAGEDSVASPTGTTKADEAVKKVRPLSVSAANALTKLVENDYQILRAEMEQFHQEQVANAIREMRGEASDENKKIVLDKAHKLLAKYRADCSKLQKEASDKNIKLTLPSLQNYAGTPSATDETLEHRVRQYQNQKESEFKTLMLSVRRQELEAKRRVLIASITTEAEDILASIPTAKEVMVRMYAEKIEETREITA